MSRRDIKAVHEYSRVLHPKTNKANLYQLKSGPRKGSHLGANFYDFTAVGGTGQMYGASEAPYHVDDYLRMVVDRDARTLVSLTTPRDYYTRRLDHPVDVHHLPVGKTVEFDQKGLLHKSGGVSVQCIAETLFESPYPQAGTVLVKRYQVRREKVPPHEILHITYGGWADRGFPAHPNAPLALIRAVDESQQALGAQRDRHPVIVNCGMGRERTNAFIMMHQMASVMNRRMAELIPEDTKPDMKTAMMMVLAQQLREEPQQVNVQRFIDTSAKLAIPFPRDSLKPGLLEEFPQRFMEAEIERMAGLAGVNPQNPALPASGPHTDALKKSPSHSGPRRS